MQGHSETRRAEGPESRALLRGVVDDFFRQIWVFPVANYMEGLMMLFVF